MTAGRRHPKVTAVALGMAAIAALLIVQVARDSAGAAGGGPVAAKSKLVTKTAQLSQLDQRTRLEVLCPKGKFPYGGGFTTSPAPTDGEGVYPNSFERLGVQHGYHITANLVDLKNSNATPRNVTLQVVCGPKPPKLTPPHQTIQVDPGQRKQIIEKCPGNRHLIGGGYQRTTRTSDDGNFVTESQMTDTDTWKVAGTAVGKFGGQMTGIAYCVRSKKPLLSEVSASTTIQPNEHGAATTAGCPKGRALVFGGFSTPEDGSVLFLGGSIGSGWTANAYNEGTAPAQLTAYGYCLRFKALLKTKKKK